MVNAPAEFVERGRVDFEKAALLREVREELGRVSGEEQRAVPARTANVSTALFPPSDSLLTFLIVLAWFAGGVVLWLSLQW